MNDDGPSLVGTIALLVLAAFLSIAALLWIGAREDAIDRDLERCSAALVADPFACIPTPTTEGTRP
jgi:hypothetical protein